MVKVVVRELDQPKSSARAKWKTVRTQDGRITRLRVLDAESESFEGDLLRAFKANVRRARRDNREAAVK